MKTIIIVLILSHIFVISAFARKDMTSFTDYELHLLEEYKNNNQFSDHSTFLEYVRNLIGKENVTNSDLKALKICDILSLEHKSVLKKDFYKRFELLLQKPLTDDKDILSFIANVFEYFCSLDDQKYYLFVLKFIEPFDSWKVHGIENKMDISFSSELTSEQTEKVVSRIRFLAVYAFVDSEKTPAIELRMSLLKDRINSLRTNDELKVEMLNIVKNFEDIQNSDVKIVE